MTKVPDTIDVVLQLRGRGDDLSYAAAGVIERLDILLRDESAEGALKDDEIKAWRVRNDIDTEEIERLKRDDEVHWKTRRIHLRKIDAWKRINKDSRDKLRAVVSGYFNDSGAEPSVSVLGRAVDEANDFLQSTRSDSPNYKNTVSTLQETK